MLVVVWHHLVSVARQVAVGVNMRSGRRGVGVRRVDRCMRSGMLMLMAVRMLVLVSVRMAMRHVAVGVQVVMQMLVRVYVLVTVRFDRLEDLGHRVPPYGGFNANHWAHDGS